MTRNYVHRRFPRKIPVRLETSCHFFYFLFRTTRTSETRVKTEKRRHTSMNVRISQEIRIIWVPIYVYVQHNIQKTNRKYSSFGDGKLLKKPKKKIIVIRIYEEIFFFKLLTLNIPKYLKYYLNFFFQVCRIAKGVVPHTKG